MSSLVAVGFHVIATLYQSFILLYYIVAAETTLELTMKNLINDVLKQLN